MWLGACGYLYVYLFSSVSSVTQSCRFFATLRTAACQASLSITYSQSPHKPMSLSRWCHPTILSSVDPSPPAFNLSQHQSIFQGVSSLHQGAKVLEFQLQISPSNEYSGLISFRMDWLDLLAVQGTLNSLLQHHGSKASILQCSAFFIVQLSHLFRYDLFRPFRYDLNQIP